MSILSERKTWQRESAPREIPRLTSAQRRNVRRVLAHLVAELGARTAAHAMGLTEEAFGKIRQPSRKPSMRVVVLAAYVAGVETADVLAGRWETHRCPACGHIGPHDAVPR